MYVTTKKMPASDSRIKGIKRVYVNFSHPFNELQSLSNLTLTQHADLVYDVNTLEIIKNRDNVELTDDLLQQINDVLLIQEL